eukprot:scaffold148_cov144-Isochrysis_galbana.AAC.6
MPKLERPVEINARVGEEAEHVVLAHPRTQGVGVHQIDLQGGCAGRYRVLELFAVRVGTACVNGAQRLEEL